MESQLPTFSLKQIESDPKKYYPDAKKYLNLLNEDAEEKGWSVKYDGKISKKFKDCVVKVQTRKNGEGPMLARSEGKIVDVELDRFFEISNPKIRKEFDEKIKSAEIVKKVNNNLTIYHTQFAMPFPMTNREFVILEFTAHNQRDKTLYEDMGLPKKDTPCYVRIIESIDLEEIPVTKDLIRGEMNQFFIFEEDKAKSTVLNTRNCTKMDMKGNIPDFMADKMAPKMAKKNMKNLLKFYNKK